MFILMELPLGITLLNLTTHFQTENTHFLTHLHQTLYQRLSSQSRICTNIAQIKQSIDKIPPFVIKLLLWKVENTKQYSQIQ